MQTFEEAKAWSELLNNVVANASKKLNEFPRSASGLVSDEIRLSYDYRLAKNVYMIAAEELRKFNKSYVKQFKKELAAERKAKYAAGTLKATPED